MPQETILHRLRNLFRTRDAANGTGPMGALIPFVRRAPRRSIALALQGGGAHGAFTWGVLDRILDDAGVRIEAISGTSAGAINAAILASGFAEGGATAAKESLRLFWKTLTQHARVSPLQPTPLESVAFGRDQELSFSYMWRDMVSRVVSPYQFNPLDLNPLRDVLTRFVDIEAVRKPDAIRLFVAATNAETGDCRIFTNEELSLDVLLASACLPNVSQAVKLDDGWYWDGGFTANPPVLPLIEATTAPDVVVVRLNPSSEQGLPVTAPKIQSRVSRIVFDAPLKHELETLERLRALAVQTGERSRTARRFAEIRLHTIAEDELMLDLGHASKLHPDARLVRVLFEKGYAAGAAWLAAPSDRMPKQAATARPFT